MSDTSIPPDRSGTGDRDPSVRALAIVWQSGLLVGIFTAALGLVIALHPSTSLNVICVMAGIIVMIGGAFQLVRAFSDAEAGHALHAIAGVVMIVVGLVLIRHLDLTKLLAAFVIGVGFIVRGVIDLCLGLSRTAQGSRAWPITSGILHLAAGIVVLAVPESSVTFLAALIGVWFVVLGAMQVALALILRHQLMKSATE
jgi:uncharacterized membrane protein HdeD (DUF308 family)